MKSWGTAVLKWLGVTWGPVAAPSDLGEDWYWQHGEDGGDDDFELPTNEGLKW